MFCENCGAKITGKEKFCPKCGEHIVPDIELLKEELSEQQADFSAETEVLAPNTDFKTAAVAHEQSTVTPANDITEIPEYSIPDQKSVLNVTEFNQPQFKTENEQKTQQFNPPSYAFAQQPQYQPQRTQQTVSRQQPLYQQQQYRPQPTPVQPGNFSDVFSNNNIDLQSQIINNKKKSHKKAIVAIIVTLAILATCAVGAYFVIPYFVGIKAEEYTTVELIDDNNTIYDDYITAEIKIDVAKLAGDEGIHDEEDIKDIIKYCEIGYEIKREGDGFISVPADEVLTVNNLKKDDVISVSLNWDKNNSSISRIKSKEKSVGIHFLRNQKIIEFKISDLIKDDNLSVEQGYEFDFFDSNITGGVKDGYDFYLSAGKGTIPGTNYTYEFDCEKGLSIYESDGNLLGQVDIEYYIEGSSQVYTNDFVPYSSDYQVFIVEITKPNVKNIFFTTTTCTYKSH